jgi:hypothetical protein
MDMTISAMVYKRALAMLWSAGHAPTRSQRIRMQGEAWRVPLAEDWLMRRPAVNEAAADLLLRFGYLADATRPYDEALPETQTMHDYAPMPGHAVRITGDKGWMGVEKGDLMTLSSCSEQGRLHIGRGHHTLSESGSVSLSNGGPSSMLGLRTAVLGRTDEIVRMRFWRFHLSPEANGGVDFTRPVPVWTWDGDASAFDELMAEAA